MHLDPNHLKDLQSSGLSDETVAMMRAYSMSPAEITRFVGQDIMGIISALAFPYFNCQGKQIDFARLKLFPPRTDSNGHQIKYIQKKGTASRLYMLPAVSEGLTDATKPLYVVEGEKKTAKAVELGLCAVGIGGVWNWVKAGERELIEDFDEINLWRRRVTICVDSDAWSQEKKAEHIRRGAYYLARELKNRGANIGFLKLGE